MDGMVMQLVSQLSSSRSHLLFNRSQLNHFSSPKIHATQISSTSRTIARRSLSLLALTSSFSSLIFFSSTNSTSWSKTLNLEFVELPDSGGVRALDLRIGDGEIPVNGDKVAIHYYGRLAAKQGWRFDSTYDHKDETGEAIPFEFILGTGKVISGIESAVRSMRVGGIRRVIIPPSEGYQNTLQEPIPPNILNLEGELFYRPWSPLSLIKFGEFGAKFFDRQRLFTTIFNPTRLANGEGSTLGTLIFDIELVSLRHQ